MKIIFYRELLTSWRNLQNAIQPLIFFMFTLMLFPISIGSDADSLNTIAPAAIYLSLIFAILLASEQLYHNDYNDGTLSQDCLSKIDLHLIILIKIIAVWLRFILPLILISPILLIMLNISLNNLIASIALLLLSSLSLLFLASIGASLTLIQNNNAFLRFLITLPFYIPILIIAITAQKNQLNQLDISGYYALLTALLLFSGLISLTFTVLAIKNQPLP